MKSYRAEDNADLEFEFPDELICYELDVQGSKLPMKMSLVDLVIEREKDILLIEIKDPSHVSSTEKERRKYFKRLSDNSILTEELTPKARNSYTYQHLMKRDHKPFIYVVLIGLDAFDPIQQQGLLSGFKDRLLADIRCESFEPWKRLHIQDCVVLSVEFWNRKYPHWPIKRLSSSVETRGD